MLVSDNWPCCIRGLSCWRTSGCWAQNDLSNLFNYLGPWWHRGPTLLLRATPRSLVLLKLRPVLMSTAYVNIEAHSNQACWSQKAVLSWIQPSLPLGELTQWPRHRRTGFVPCLRGPTKQFSYLSSTYTQTGLANPNIYLIHELPECMKGLVLRSHNYGISMTGETLGYIGILVRIQYWRFTRSQKSWTRPKTYCNKYLQINLFGKKGSINCITQCISQSYWYGGRGDGEVGKRQEWGGVCLFNILNFFKQLLF